MSTETDRARDFLEREAAKRKRRKPTLTLEHGHGETYSHSRPVLYGHSPYERGSVLYGRDMRCWLAQWDTWEQARADLAEAKIKYDDMGDRGGSTHVPIEQVVAHLPDDTDY